MDAERAVAAAALRVGDACMAALSTPREGLQHLVQVAMCTRELPWHHALLSYGAYGVSHPSPCASWHEIITYTPGCINAETVSQGTSTTGLQEQLLRHAHADRLTRVLGGKLQRTPQRAQIPGPLCCRAWARSISWSRSCSSCPGMLGRRAMSCCRKWSGS